MILDDEQVAAIGEGAKRFPVIARVNGFQWRTTVTRMRGEFLLGLNRDVREGGRPGGKSVDGGRVVTAPREVEVPAALASALAADAAASKRWGSLAYTHRKEYARWVGEAKRAETRERRVARAIEMMREGETLS